MTDRTTLPRNRVEQEVDAEIAFHLAMRTERLRAKGLTDDDARSLAQRCSQWDLRSSGACYGGAMHGTLSLVET